MEWKEAIIQVLRNANSPMHYVAIAEEVQKQGLKNTEDTATPAGSVAATIAVSIKNEGSASPFVRVALATYSLREFEKQPPKELQETENGTESSEITGVINAFGMFWDRSKVKWKIEPKALGKQAGGKSLDFSGQKGVYLLHDSQGVVYVGAQRTRLLADA